MRITERKLYKEIVRSVAKRSTCCERKTGAIIVNTGRIISTGWNGVSTGFVHCETHFRETFIDQFVDKTNKAAIDKKVENNDLKDVIESEFEKWRKSMDFIKAHGDFARQNELCAELNAVLFAKKDRLKNAELYLVQAPCLNCSKIISQSGINSVLYINEDERDFDGLHLLRENNIKAIKL